MKALAKIGKGKTPLSKEELKEFLKHFPKTTDDTLIIPYTGYIYETIKSITTISDFDGRFDKETYQKILNSLNKITEKSK